MKRFRKVKLFALTGLLIMGMSSCLKTEDPQFAIVGGNWYVMQRNSVSTTDTTSSFAPYIAFMTNEPLAKASVTSVSYPLGVSGKTSGAYWESNLSGYDYETELKKENYKITAYNAAEEVAIYSFELGVDKEKALGVLNSTFTYDSTKGITVTWKSIKNANYFELYAWEASDSDKKIVVQTTKTGSKMEFDNYSASNKGFESGKSYVFELVAYYVDSNTNVMKIKLMPTGDNRKTITSWGTSEK